MVPAIARSQGQKKPPARAPQTKKPAPSVNGTVIFAVNKYEDSASIDPIVIYNKGQYINPLPDNNEAFVKQLAAKYIRAGQKYRVIFGGAEAGTVTIKNRYESEIGLTTSVTLQSAIKLSSEVKALATNSTRLARRLVGRGIPTRRLEPSETGYR